MAKSVTPPDKKLYEARLKHDLRLYAQVADAQLNISFKRHTEVIAEQVDATYFVIAAQYGRDGTAIATVSCNDLIFA